MKLHYMILALSSALRVSLTDGDDDYDFYRDSSSSMENALDKAPGLDL